MPDTISSSLSELPNIQSIIPAEDLAKESTFELFPRFPKELQLKIWSEAHPGPRVIEIDHKGPPNIPPHSKRYRVYLSLLIARYEPPALLHACRDARAIALKSYKLCFDELLSSPVYFDTTQDILLFANGTALQNFCLGKRYELNLIKATPESLRKYDIRYLALDPLEMRIYGCYDLKTPVRKYGQLFYCNPEAAGPAFTRALRKIGTLKDLVIFRPDVLELYEAGFVHKDRMETYSISEYDKVEDAILESAAGSQPGELAGSPAWNAPNVVHIVYKPKPEEKISDMRARLLERWGNKEAVDFTLDEPDIDCITSGPRHNPFTSPRVVARMLKLTLRDPNFPGPLNTSIRFSRLNFLTGCSLMPIFFPSPSDSAHPRQSI